MKKNRVIAVDGPSGTGKSTLSKLLARRLGYTYIDTGAMYRAVALSAYEAGVDSDDEKALKKFCADLEVEAVDKNSSFHLYIDGVDYSDRIRTPFVGDLSSRVSSKHAVREALVNLQQELGRSGRVVMEGRDIGTVVFPHAGLKFYLDASPEVRGRRRYAELKERGEAVDLEQTIREIEERDRRDSSRTHSPLRRADDAVYIDTSDKTIDGVLEEMLKCVRSLGDFASNGRDA